MFLIRTTMDKIELTGEVEVQGDKKCCKFKKVNFQLKGPKAKKHFLFLDYLR